MLYFGTRCTHYCMQRTHDRAHTTLTPHHVILRAAHCTHYITHFTLHTTHSAENYHGQVLEQDERGADPETEKRELQTWFVGE